MKKECEIVRDLIPAYLDDLCSNASREVVETHIRECEACKVFLEEVRQGVPEDVPQLLDEEDVLRRTAWKLSKRAIGCAVGVTAIVLYWLIYLWQDWLAGQGNYTYFPYQFYETYSIGYLLVPLLSVVWLAVVLVRTFRRKTWAKNTALLAVLTLLICLQIGYLHGESQKISVSTFTTVECIPDEYHIVLDRDDMPITLRTTPMITNLLQTDGTIYGIEFEYRQTDPAQGTLLFISAALDPSEQ